ncbi:laminin subunit gamma-2 [Gouania willdenowi]|uniref:Laminin subunit gamma-2-like n=1 Tax=Gouania willdenowi TaxID=441366 RepID=A0A8C5GXP8_GOUWI|nr:laminin subunit gamma-2-like [Gouania willdenowi]
MKRTGFSLYGLLVAIYVAQATHTYYSKLRCECNGRSQYCLPDAVGLHCLDCQGNTEGRHCERCKKGFFLQGLSCTPCHCNPTGSVSSACDQTGRCSCKELVTGEKCDQCPNGPIGPNGCSQRRQLREDSGLMTSTCFCYGHSSQCSPKPGYSIHNVSSTFTDSPENWKVATMQGLTPDNTHFRWSPKHQDLEVISKNSLPIYLYAPDSYLGNQLHSYGQNLSFSLRLDRGIRYPSSNDVILEGAGLRVGASLGDLRFTIPCGKKIDYSFRLDEKPSSGWSPRLSTFQFQTLLQNLTAIKIRSTFGENGRGYLDNVRLVSARPGNGISARWVQTCSCPQGHEGDLCERCSPGFRRSVPEDGAFSSCEPCSCTGGSCDPKTGDCYSADEIQGDSSCSEGFYRNPTQPDTCVKCPCPQGISCALDPGASLPRCHGCPKGTTGLRCDTCEEGFYAVQGSTGSQPSCKPCQCNGHIDLSVAGSCDRKNGKCLKCMNNTMGQSCETCIKGFYHSQLTDACKPCNCHPQSESEQCDDLGQCKCRLGFEGQKCQWSSCPSCFNPIKKKMEVYSDELKKLERQVMDGDLRPSNTAQMKAALREAEEMVNDMQDNAELLAELERKLISRQSSISKSQLNHGKDIQKIADSTDELKQQQQKYKTKAKQVQTLLDEMETKLGEAKRSLQRIELPLGDSPLDSNVLSRLMQAALGLADKHNTTANAVGKTASAALADSEKSLDLVKNLVNKENKVKGLVENLSKMFDQIPGQVKGLEKQAISVANEAKDESKRAENMLKEIGKMESNILPVLKDDIRTMVSRMDKVKKQVGENTLGLDDLRDAVQLNKDKAEKELTTGKAAQKEVDKLKDRVDVAKVNAENALKNINLNTKELDSALDTIRGFDHQIDTSKAAADESIKRLPKISGIVKQASKNNAEMLSHLGTVSEDFNDALGAINNMEALVNNLEKTLGSLPSHDDLLNEATRLNREAQALKTTMTNTAVGLSSELDEAKRLEADAEDASIGAAAAFNHAKQARDVVSKTLQDVNTLLANMNKPGVKVDEKQLKQLEDELANAQREVEDNLRPKLQDMEKLEDAHRRRLEGIKVDIETILADIINLEDILKSIPSGCYNSARELP